jgi:hypothetical protein
VRDQEFGDDRPLPASRTGRVPQWVRDEAAGRPVQPDPWRSWSAPAGVTALAPRRRRSRLARLGRSLAVVVVVGLLVAAVLLVDRTGVLGGRALPPIATDDRPSPGAGAEDEPLGTPVEAPVEGGTHAFVGLQPGSDDPIAYDPCRPISYVERPDGAPPGSEVLLREAFDRVSALTGLRFVAEGPTDEQPSPDRELFQPDRYGDRWAPVLVTWETAEQNPDLATAAGMGGSAWLEPPGRPRVYVTGAITLDADDFRQMLSWPDGWSLARAVVLHEIGHVVGLDHVDDPTQLMHPEAGAARDFASGDLTGLARLGRGECVPDL